MPKKTLRYASTEMMVFGKADFEDKLSMAEAVKQNMGDTRPIEILVQCSKHQAEGVLALYEDGLIVFGCKVCGERVGQVEVAERGRPWGKVKMN